MLFHVWSTGLTNPQNKEVDTTFDGMENDFENFSKDSSSDVSAASPIVPAAGQNCSNSTNPISTAGPSSSNSSSTHGNSSLRDASQSPDVLEMENIVYVDNENIGAEADFNNLVSSITVSPIRTTRIHNAHPISQIIGNLSSTTQTKSMARIIRDQGGISQVLNEDFHTCMFACFLLQEEPKRVKQKEDGIFINQDKYVAEILKKFGLTEGKSASTPIVTEKPLLKDPDGEDVDVHIYRSMIGSLMYLTSSRPNIMFATVGHEAAYGMSWKILMKLMTDKYCPRNEIRKLEIELWELKVKGTDLASYTQRFKELALLCGRMFAEEADKIEKYVRGLPDMIYGSVVESKPKTMQEATEIATELMDKKILTFAERETASKRKLENTSRTTRNQQQQQQHSNKRQNTGRVYTAAPGGKKQYGGSKPLCAKCNYHHDGPCAPKCQNCNRIGHSTSDCRNVANANNANNQRGTEQGQKPTCYECGVKGHYKRECPKLRNNNNQGNQGGRNNAPARVYAVGRAGTDPDANVVTGQKPTCYECGVKGHYKRECPKLRNNNNQRNQGGRNNAPARVYAVGHAGADPDANVVTDLMPVELGSFDAIIGMDYLAKYKAIIICAEKIVRIPWGNETLIIHGDCSNKGMRHTEHG
nr:hypothetical protein [Tanacetum cinerariifolium]